MSEDTKPAKAGKQHKREDHTLLKPHRHHGKDLSEGDKIRLREDQVARLRKAEKIA